jgi:hypothetical protein
MMVGGRGDDGVGAGGGDEALGELMGGAGSRDGGDLKRVSTESGVGIELHTLSTESIAMQPGLARR